MKRIVVLKDAAVHKYGEKKSMVVERKREK
jgi:hypothetical protein